jgi:hypothetical protein
MEAIMYKNNRRVLSLVIAGLFLMVLIMGCGNKTTNATPESVVKEPSQAPATATNGQSPTVVPTKAPPVISCTITSSLKPEWKTKLCETFDNNTKGWVVGDQSSDLMNADVKIEGGKYIINYGGKAVKGYDSATGSVILIGDSKDFAVTIKGKFDTDNKYVGWGVVFRSTQSKDGYAFRISREGKYGFQRIEAGALFPLITAKSSNLIKLDQDNTISIVAEGSHFDFYINDSKVNSYEDAKLTGSRLNLALYLQEGAKSVFEFDEILVKTP